MKSDTRYLPVTKQISQFHSNTKAHCVKMAAT